MSALTRRIRAALVVTATLVPGVAGAQGSGEATSQCIAAHVEAQRLQKSAKLREARAALVRCSDPSCPSVLVQECTDLFAELDRAVPSLVFVARDDQGKDIADARVLDGDAVLLTRLDGKAVEVDPGEHRFRVERAGGDVVEQKLVVREGDKLRRVEVVFGAGATPPSPLPAEGERQVTPAFWIVGSAGLAGLALFGGLAGAGLAKKSDLDDRACAPACPSSDVDEVRSLFLGADISLGIGIAALAVAPILYFTSPIEPAATSSRVFVAPLASAEHAGLVCGGTW